MEPTVIIGTPQCALTGRKAHAKLGNIVLSFMVLNLPKQPQLKHRTVMLHPKLKPKLMLKPKLRDRGSLLSLKLTLRGAP